MKENSIKNERSSIKENKELKNYANCKGTPPPEPQLPTKTLCESFSKKRRK